MDAFQPKGEVVDARKNTAAALRIGFGQISCLGNTYNSNGYISGLVQATNGVIDFSMDVTKSVIL
ncbi:hypothetical protein [Lentisalinibacter orientalis]|uniref:hypothetical protein n=1 Tax=Lentisalinibacter orientalis TaxID=2992241 RepID=UPI00386EC44D